MALCIRKSPNVIRSLKSKIGSLVNASLTNSHSTPFRAEDLRNPDGVLVAQPILFMNRRYKAEEGFASQRKVDVSQALDFPGGKVAFTHEMNFISESYEERIPCYRVLDDSGQIIECSNFTEVSEDTARKMYSNMVTLQVMDTIFYDAQRQGRISFYLTTLGEEAINIASAAAVTSDDIIVPQYREPGVLLWRGFTLRQFANQCFSNRHDQCKGRQMPAHYGSKEHNYFTVASTIASQLPHAVGAAYSLKMDGKNACAVAFFGDGGSSEGDFHAALNFAAVMDAPVIFICRNNGWAISTPVSEQFRSDGIAIRGPAYGLRSIRVDGNDALAMYSAVHAARKVAINEHRPILIEALTYRVGHHTTSDDSTKYRPVDEIELWRSKQDPVVRFRKWIESCGWWNEGSESELRNNVRKQVLNAIQVAEKAEKPSFEDALTDVYDVPPSNLVEQEKWLRDTIKRHPQDYPSYVPVLNAIQVAEKAEKPSFEDALTDVYDVPPSNLVEQETWLRDTIKRHPQDCPLYVPV